MRKWIHKLNRWLEDNADFVFDIDHNWILGTLVHLVPICVFPTIYLLYSSKLLAITIAFLSPAIALYIMHRLEQYYKNQHDLRWKFIYTVSKTVEDEPSLYAGHSSFYNL
jgi:hypothetical protein